jgi:hypothetical protein
LKDRSRAECRFVFYRPAEFWLKVYGELDLVGFQRHADEDEEVYLI